MSAARFDEDLAVHGFDEIPWGNQTLSAETVTELFDRLSQSLNFDRVPAAICVASFMHSFMVRTGAGPASHEFETWLTLAPPEGIAAVRKSIGAEFHERTGCRYHPMFPVFKLASTTISPSHHVVSPKSL